MHPVALVLGSVAALAAAAGVRDGWVGSGNVRGSKPQAVPVTAGAIYLSRSKFRRFRSDTDHVQDVVQGVKAGKPQSVREAASWIAKATSLRGPGIVVPIPRSTAERPSLLPLAEALVAHGVGHVARPLLARATPVASSRILRRKGLHGVSPQEHTATLAAQAPGPGEEDLPLLLVDDVTTQGNVLTGAIRRLRQAGWRGSIRAAVVARAEDDPMRMAGRPAIRPRIHVLQVTHPAPAVP